MGKKLIVTEKINLILKEKKLTAYKLSKLIGVNDSALYQMIGGYISFSPDYKEKILPFLGISEEEFESWIVNDKYSKIIIQKAIESLKIKEDKKKPVFTQNIDNLLKEKKLSRTALSKLIGNSQSGLNRIIIGKEPLSENIAGKLAKFFKLPEEDLQAWVLADKYNLKVLELALNSD